VLLRKTNSFYISVLLLLLSSISSCGESDELGGSKKTGFEVIMPESGVIQNAGTGNEIWNGGASNGETRIINFAVKVSDFAVNSMIRVNWADYEPTEGNYRFDKMDKYFDNCVKYDQKVDIACFCTSYIGNNTLSDGVLCSYPEYIHQAMQASEQKDIKYKSSLFFAPGKVTWEPNFESDYFYERYDALLKAFSDYLKTPVTFKGRQVPREKFVRCIEMRHFGLYGEGHYYVPELIPPNAECLTRFADSFIKYFPDTWICVPTLGMAYSSSYPTSMLPFKRDYHFYLLTARNNRGLLGIFRDNWGSNEAGFLNIYHSENRYEKDGKKMYELIRDRWKYAPLIGEPGRFGPSEGFQPYSNLLDQVKYLHPVVIRNTNVADGENPFNPTGYSIFNDPQALGYFHKMYSIIGFRYLITSADISQKDGNLEISLNWLNIGLTPTYDRWQVLFFIKNESGKETWSGLSTLDLRTIFPDEGTPPGEVNKGKATSHTDSFQNVPEGGSLFMKIIDPDGISPNMSLTIKGRTPDGAYLLKK
jgi:hypothetical protein